MWGRKLKGGMGNKVHQITSTRAKLDQARQNMMVFGEKMNQNTSAKTNRSHPPTIHVWCIYLHLP